MAVLRTDKKRHVWTPHHIVSVGVFCLVAVSAILAVQVVRAEGRILPNVHAGGVDIGGLTPEEAGVRLRNALRALNITGLNFTYGDRSLTIRANETSAAPPSQTPVTYDIDNMVRAAFAFGHNTGTADLLKANVQALFSDVNQPIQLSVDKKAIRDLLILRFGNMEKPAKDAGVLITRSEFSEPTANASATPIVHARFDIQFTPDSTGVTFNYEEAIERAVSGLDRWHGAAVALEATVKSPGVTAAAAEAARDRILAVLERGDVKLAYDDLTWTIPSKSLPEALILKTGPGGGIIVSLDANVLEPLLEDAAKTINSEPKSTHFRVDDNGRAVDFEGGQIGKRLDRDASLYRFDEIFEHSENSTFPLVVLTEPAADSDPIAESLGIRELLGYGGSNFAGSPNNRRKNIANGASKLNGLIIKPGEEFGLLEHLKPFNAAGGYFQELVIKENRTVPEYGGGLCQIGTTTFRAVMGAGLPVTQRQNHSYRVVYYEPAGTDATIYDPAPDFKFINDTGNHMVLITRQVGKDGLRFEFWGTRDGRVQNQGKVALWNVRPPPPARLIETSGLAEGVKKCFEVAHAGATTAFTYTITYPDGSVKEKEFRSVYKPWQAQCLIGKAGAPRISLGRDGALQELPPEVVTAGSPGPSSATSTPPVSPIKTN